MKLIEKMVEDAMDNPTIKDARAMYIAGFRAARELAVKTLELSEDTCECYTGILDDLGEEEIEANI